MNLTGNRMYCMAIGREECRDAPVEITSSTLKRHPVQSTAMTHMTPEEWKSVQTALVATIPIDAHRAWILPLSVRAPEDGVETYGPEILIEAPNEFSRSWVNDHYLTEIQAAVGAETPVRIIAAGDPNPYDLETRLAEVRGEIAQITAELEQLRRREADLKKRYAESGGREW